MCLQTGVIIHISYKLNWLSEKYRIKNCIVTVSIFLVANLCIDTIRAFACVTCAFYSSGMRVFQMNASTCDANACDANAHIRIRLARFHILISASFGYVMSDAMRAHAMGMCVSNGNL